jgi:hypothetical protein
MQEKKYDYKLYGHVIQLILLSWQHKKMPCTSFFSYIIKIRLLLMELSKVWQQIKICKCEAHSFRTFILAT